VRQLPPLGQAGLPGSRAFAFGWRAVPDLARRFAEGGTHPQPIRNDLKGHSGFVSKCLGTFLPAKRHDLLSGARDDRADH